MRNEKGQFVKGYDRPRDWVESSPITQKGREPWNKGKTAVYTDAHRKHLSEKLMGHSVLAETIAKIRANTPLNYGEEHPSWKGDKVGYYGLHNWVKKKLGKPRFCIKCGRTGTKRLEWANKSHEYHRDINDWISLCKPCHWHYDQEYWGVATKKFNL